MSPGAYHGYRVAIVGSCQVAGLRRWIERMLPGATIDAWHVNARPDWTPAVIAPAIAGHDLVISQIADGVGGGQLDFARLRASHEKVVFLPTFVFTGFHPDMISYYLKTSPTSIVKGPLAIYQSAIIVAAFHLGVAPGRVARFFNALVFEPLGYFVAFDQARAAAMKIFAEHEYDLGGAIEAWMRDGCFMYTDNHPHIRVLGTCARLAMARTGLEFADPREDTPPPDDLAASLRWPVYPALARRLGIIGSLSFTRAISDTPAGEARELPVDAFIHDSYRALAQAAPLGFHDSEAVKTASEALRRMLGPGGISAA